MKVSVGRSIIPTQLNVLNSEKVVRVQLDDEYEVEKLLGKRLNVTRQRAEYLVKWKGWDDKFNSWELIDNLNCEKLIEEFEIHRHPNITADITASGLQVITFHCVIQWNNTPYFIVPYGSNIPNKYCIVGPDKDNHKLKCKHVNHPWSSKHVKHVRLVYEAVGNPASKLADLSLDTILPNHNKNPHELGVDGKGGAEKQGLLLVT